MGGRGASSSGGGNSSQSKTPKTDEQMQRELDEHFARVNADLDDFMSRRVKSGEDLVFHELYPDSPIDGISGNDPYLRRNTLKDLTSTYIGTFNEDVDRFGNGFATAIDSDTVVSILYKDGRILRTDDMDGTTKIPTRGIDSIIVDSGDFTAIAGKHAKPYNMRETVGYGRYAYKDTKERYEDSDDIRADFTD